MSYTGRRKKEKEKTKTKGKLRKQLSCLVVKKSLNIEDKGQSAYFRDHKTKKYCMVEPQLAKLSIK